MARHLWEFLTHDEWRTAYAIAFLDMTEFGEDIDLRPYHVPSQEHTWESAMIAAVRFLALELGLDFEAVKVREEDHEILSSRTDAVEPGNLIYFQMLKLGKLPADPVRALGAAIRILNERAPSYNTEPMREAMAEIEKARSAVIAHADPEELARTVKAVDHALAIAGLPHLRTSSVLIH